MQRVYREDIKGWREEKERKLTLKYLTTVTVPSSSSRASHVHVEVSSEETWK